MRLLRIASSSSGFFHEWALRFFKLIPEGKIQPKIIFELFVVKGMVCCTDEPTRQAVWFVSTGIYLNIQVVNHAAKSHDAKLYQDDSNVHGKYNDGEE